MVIFGAGASHDSIADLADAGRLPGERPPLAADLFDSGFNEYVRRHRASGTLVAELRTRDATVDLESALDRIQSEEAPGSSLRRRELLALRYYLRELLWDVGGNWEDKHAPGQTNYHTLLKRLELWHERRAGEPMALVSFNYDTILDNAIRDVFGNPLTDIGHYMQSTRGVPLFKPHGSVNWIRVVGNDTRLSKYDGNTPDQRKIQARQTETALLDLAASDMSLDPQDQFTIVADVHTFLTPGGRVGMPALTIPVLSKAAFELPSEHQRLLGKVIPGVKWLLIIGWRATELNFLKFWADLPRHTQPRVQIVNKTREAADMTMKALNAAGIRHSEYLPYDGGFSSYLREKDRLEDFLNRRFPGRAVEP